MTERSRPCALRHSRDSFTWDSPALPSFSEAYESLGNCVTFCARLASACSLASCLTSRTRIGKDVAVIKKTVLSSELVRNSFEVAAKHVALGKGLAIPLAKVAVVAYLFYRFLRLLRSDWRETRTLFDGQDDIAFCGHCSPQILRLERMTLGSAYVKRFHVPSSCPRCSWFWPWASSRRAEVRVGRSHYQFLGTYSALRMQRQRDVHCPAVNQLDVTNEYSFVHRFLQLHAGTIGAMEKQSCWWYSCHTRSYCTASQWEELDVNSEEIPTPPLSAIQRMRTLWQFLEDHLRQLPQSTVLSSAFTRCRELVGDKMDAVSSITSHARMAALEVDSRVADDAFLSPPAGLEMTAVALPSAQAVGPVTHCTTIHNAQDRLSVITALEGRSTVKKSVFPNADGTFDDLCFKKNSRAASALNKFWRKFNLECLTDEAIDRAYHHLFADKNFEEIAMSKFSKEDIEAIKVELETTTKPEKLSTRKANGKLESVMKEKKPARLVVDNTLQLLALNIISTAIFQHILFDEHDGIFYSMSIKHRARDEVLDNFGKWMQDPFGDKARVAKGLAPRVVSTCSWEIDQTGMELHERCSRQGEGLLGYTYNALLRINSHVSHKMNAQFCGLHEAKIVHDVKTGMRIRFRIKNEALPKESWFTAKFPDMYLDSGWALTSGVNFINELSGVFASITENPQHLFAVNPDTGRFRLQDGTFDWRFTSIPLYQSPAATEPSSFPIYLRGLFEGDDGGGAASRCLHDPRNGGPQGLIVRQQEDLGYSAKFKTIVDGRLEIIGAHFPVRHGCVCDDVPWVPAVQRYTSKLGTQTNVHITPSSTAARFLSLAAMFSGRIEPLQRAFEYSAERIISAHGKDKEFWTKAIRTDGYSEIDRAFGNGLHCSYTLDDLKAYYDRCAVQVHQTSDVQIRMLNMSLAEDVAARQVTREDYCKLCMFADECSEFVCDDEAAYLLLPASFR